MKTISYYKITALIDELPSEIKKTFMPHVIQEAFKEVMRNIKEQEEKFTLTLSIVYDRYSATGHRISSREQVLEERKVTIQR